MTHYAGLWNARDIDDADNIIRDFRNAYGPYEADEITRMISTTPNNGSPFSDLTDSYSPYGESDEERAERYQLWFRILWTGPYGASASEELLTYSNQDYVENLLDGYGLDYRCVMAGNGIDVPVYNGGDSANGFTHAFMVGWVLYQAMQEYPLLDDSDYSEREYNAWLEWAEGEMRDLSNHNDHEYDTVAENDAILSMSFGPNQNDEYLNGYITFNGYEDDPNDYAEIWETVRNDYFDSLAREFLAPITGQDTLDIATDATTTNHNKEN